MPINDIILMIVKRDPKQLSASSIESMIKEGDSATVAQMMLDNGHLFPAFLELLVHQKWPVRLGAMVAMETIVEKASDLAARAIDPLWEKFSGVDDTVKGDILYLLGEIGNHDTISRLETIIATNANPEVQEAAVEAVDRIKERQ
jgi:HEAT repeat protein